MGKGRKQAQTQPPEPIDENVFSRDVFDALEELLNSMPDDNRHVILMIDEYDYESVTNIRETNTDLYKPIDTPNRFFTFVLKDVKNTWYQPVGTVFWHLKFVTDSNGDYVSYIDNTDLEASIVMIIKALQRINFNIVCTVSSPFNRIAPVMSYLSKKARIENPEYDDNEFVYTVNGKEIVHIFDAVEMLRLVRNRFISRAISFVENDKRKETSSSQLQLWIRLTNLPDQLKYLSEETHIRPITNSKEHSNFTNVVQLFSETVAKKIDEDINLVNVAPDYSDLSDLIRLFDKLFDSLNGHPKSKKNKIYLKPLKDGGPQFKLWEQAIPILKTMRFSSQFKELVYSEVSQNEIFKQWIITIKGMNRIYQTLKTLQFATIYTGYFNCDCVRMFIKKIMMENAAPVPHDTDKKMEFYLLDQKAADLSLHPTGTAILVKPNDWVKRMY